MSEDEAMLLPKDQRGHYRQMAEYLEELNTTKAITGPVKWQLHEDSVGVKYFHPVIASANGDVFPIDYAFKQKANLLAGISGMFWNGCGDDEKRLRKGIEYAEKAVKTINELRDIKPFAQQSFLLQSYVVLGVLYKGLGDKEKAEHYEMLAKKAKALAEC